MNYNKLVELVYMTKNIIKDKHLRNKIMEKGAADFVTEVDLNISNFLKYELKKLYPDIGFITEEEPSQILTEKCFILDPIDGTTNLIYDYRMSSVSLAYIEKGVVIFGIVYNPFSKELFFGLKGNGSYVYDVSKGIGSLLKIGIENYKKNKLNCSNRELNKSIIEFGAGSTHKENTEENFNYAKNIFYNCLDLRRICSTAITLSYIACGRIDGYFEKIIKPWDFAAGSLLITEAGGKITDWDNNTLPLNKITAILASNGIIHNNLLEILK